MSLPKKPADPVLQKMVEAHRLLKQAHDELGNRAADPRRSVARTYLAQSAQTLRRAIDFEKGAV